MGTPDKPFTLKPRSKQRGRPRQIDKNKFDNNWDKIFGSKKMDCNSKMKRKPKMMGGKMKKKRWVI